MARESCKGNFKVIQDKTNPIEKALRRSLNNFHTDKSSTTGLLNVSPRVIRTVNKKRDSKKEDGPEQKKKERCMPLGFILYVI